ncbi:MAG: DUF2062 domain-containing protein [Kiritimatiellales bacterium]
MVLPEKNEKRTRSIRDYLRIAVYQHATPEQIALGFCIGLFVGLSPLFGVQMMLAFLLALALRGSKISAMITVWITNPLTALPVYSFTYWIGSHILKSPVNEKPLRRFLSYCIHHLTWENYDEARTILYEALQLGRGILPPLFLGGFIVALACSLIGYPLVIFAVHRFRTARSMRIQKKKLHIKPSVQSGDTPRDTFTKLDHSL